jgi:hypothetical protein
VHRRPVAKERWRGTEGGRGGSEKKLSEQCVWYVERLVPRVTCVRLQSRAMRTSRHSASSDTHQGNGGVTCEVLARAGWHLHPALQSITWGSSVGL